MTIDVSAITSAFVEFGGQIISKRLNSWNLHGDFNVRGNVTTPQVLPKLTAGGGPRPYSITEHFSGNEPIFTDRTLTVNQSKWDFQIDMEEIRNTYLAKSSSGDLDPKSTPLYKFILDYYMQNYLDQIYSSALASGTYNSAGTTVAAIMTGLLTKINALVAATTIPAGQVIATGALTTANAVTKVEEVADALPAWMKQDGFKILCSFGTLEKYRKHYRTTYGYSFDKTETGKYQLDGVNGTLEPRAYLNSSGKLIAIPAKESPFYIGYNKEAVKLYPTPHLNTIKNRLLFPIGLEVGDCDTVYVNDQA